MGSVPGATDRRGGMKRNLALGAALGALATGAVAGSAAADTYVYVSDGTAWQLNGKESDTFLARPESDVLGAAFDETGRLWIAQSAGDDETCVLTSPDAPGVEIRPGDLAYPGGTRTKNIRMCEPVRGPGNSLLVEGHNGSLGSVVTWQMNLDTYALRRIAPGYQPAVGPGGRFATVRHTYESRGKVTVWEALNTGSVFRPASIRRAVPRPRSYSSPGSYWQGPSFAPDGRLAVARSGRPVVGRPGAWAAVGSRGMGAHRTAWDSTGDLYVIGSTGQQATLEQIPGGHAGPTSRWISESSGISALAIGPDSSAATATVPSVVGEPVTSARSILGASGFTLDDTQAPGDPSRSPESGTVVTQSPAPGSVAARRNPVMLIVQEG